MNRTTLITCSRCVRRCAVVAAAALGLAVACVPSADASIIWGSDASGELIGSRSSAAGGGVTATGQWANSGFSISWNISEMGGMWTYVYSIDVTATATQIKNVSHFLLEVTSDEEPFNVLGGTSTPREGPETWTTTDPENPGLPNNLYGVKFDYGSVDGMVDYTIVTDRAPVYGVFYAKDGKSGGPGGGIDVIAYSDALAFADYKTNEGLTASQFIVRPNGSIPPPNGGEPVVPEPASILVWSGLAALIGLIAYRRR